MPSLTHPLDHNREYQAQPDGSVRVTDRSTGKDGYFAVDGRWLSGDIRDADIQFVCFVARRG